MSINYWNIVFLSIIFLPKITSFKEDLAFRSTQASLTSVRKYSKNQHEEIDFWREIPIYNALLCWQDFAVLTLE